MEKVDERVFTVDGSEDGVIPTALAPGWAFIDWRDGRLHSAVDGL
jgi:hypothetical protein